ncbi:cell division protein ZipA [Pseudomonas coleopterorum]|uniref:cell division protein ZipA n=1 Tax=Pseudomonas coleopterorum TaxID=1605838 RepID=UPI0017851EE0|nr:cell division protein ZipA [Pseudomonas coleopterorum]MBD8481788.1 cell division protein ZipA [Pseudomonas coleopterorum]
MEIGLREWLILIGIIVIAGILFDGWRRMRGGKGKLKFRLDRNLSNLPDEDTGAEVLGPPRVLDDHKEPQLDEHDLPSMSAQRDGGSKRAKREPVADHADLNLAVEPDEIKEPREPRPPKPPREPKPAKPQPPMKAARDSNEDFASDAKGFSSTGAPAIEKDLPPVEEVLVISVISRSESGFRGPALLQNILESGLRFGEMDIFHRHESMAGNGEILFSMANAVKPGIFDLDDIDHFSTRAVSFFLGLPGPRHPKQAFDVMVAAARKLAHELDGELKDDQRSVLTAQTIEHYRQRIVEFERRALTHKR